VLGFDLIEKTRTMAIN